MNAHRALAQTVAPTVPVLARLLVLALLGGGLIGGVTNFLGLQGFWPWTLPALAQRFLAAAAAAYVVGSAITLRRTRWIEHEFVAVTVLIYGIFLVLAILMQTALIDWSTAIAWTFLAVVIPAMVVAAVYVWQKRAEVPREADGRLTPAARTFLLVLGLAAALLGLIVFVVPSRSGIIWPWAALKAWAPLTSRLTASMLLTIGGGAFLARARNDRGALAVFLGMLWAYCLVAAVGLVLHARTTPAFLAADTVYIVIFLVVSLAGTAVLAGAHHPSV